MANVTLPGTGTVIRTDPIAGVEYQIVKLAAGGVGAATLVETAAPLPVVLPGVAATTPLAVSEPEQTFTNQADQTISADAEVFAAVAFPVTRTIIVPPDADTGVRIMFGATATGTSMLLPKGFVGRWRTRQAIRAIKAGSASVVISKSQSVDS